MDSRRPVQAGAQNPAYRPLARGPTSTDMQAVEVPTSEGRSGPRAPGVFQPVPGCSGQAAVQPPSTTSIVPVIYRDESDARNSAASASSSGAPTLPMGTAEVTFAASPGSWRRHRVSGVSIQPGQSALARMPYSAYSTARFLVRWMSAGGGARLHHTGATLNTPLVPAESPCPGRGLTAPRLRCRRERGCSAASERGGAQARC